MVRLRISPNEVRRMFNKVKHGKFHRVRELRWKVNEENGTVNASSVMWLFCWAYDGDKHLESMLDCREIFNHIFPFSFNMFLMKVGYVFAVKARYPENYPGRDFEKELEYLLEKRCPQCGSGNLLNFNFGLTPSEDEDWMYSAKDARRHSPFISAKNCHWQCNDCSNEF